MQRKSRSEAGSDTAAELALAHVESDADYGQRPAVSLLQCEIRLRETFRGSPR